MAENRNAEQAAGKTDIERVAGVPPTPATGVQTASVPNAGTETVEQPEALRSSHPLDIPTRERPAPPISRIGLPPDWPEAPTEVRSIDGLIATVRFLRTTLREVQEQHEWQRKDRDMVYRKYRRLQRLYGSLHATARAYLQEGDRYEELTQFRDWQSIDIEYPDGSPSDTALRARVALEPRQ